MTRIRPLRCVIAALIFLQIIFIFHLPQRKTAPLVKREGKKEKVHLLILSTWRSGSSLVGQFFSQHPDVFYLMEPAWHVWRTLFPSSPHVFHMAVRDLVQSVFKCDFSVLDAYMRSNRNVSELFHWYDSRALCSPPACYKFSHDDIINGRKCKRHCGNYSFAKAEQTCKTYRHIVVKAVRFFDLSVLYPLLKNPSLNLKILHLVRDPRATARSRRRALLDLASDNGIVLNTNGTKINDTKYLVLRKICQSHANIYKMATQDPPSFLEGRYRMVRYEDMMRDPVREVQEIYKFASLEMTVKLGWWIYNMTHSYELPQHNGAFQITPRNALNVSQAWRTELPFQTVMEIQKVCKEAMDSFGYRFMTSEKHQQDLLLDFILPRPKH
ncbi:carbohydrate sulfotransferase 6-like [Gastrophryne carolinensis]